MLWMHESSEVTPTFFNVHRGIKLPHAHVLCSNWYSSAHWFERVSSTRLGTAKVFMSNLKYTTITLTFVKVCSEGPFPVYFVFDILPCVGTAEKLSRTDKSKLPTYGVKGLWSHTMWPEFTPFTCMKQTREFSHHRLDVWDSFPAASSSKIGTWSNQAISHCWINPRVSLQIYC